MNRRLFLPLLVAAALTACESGLGPTSVFSDVATVTREGNSIRITNLTNQPRGFVAHDNESLTLAATCNTTDAACLRLPANGSVLVALADVVGYTGNTKDVTVTTFRVVTSGTDPVFDEPLVLKL